MERVRKSRIKELFKSLGEMMHSFTNQIEDVNREEETTAEGLENLAHEAGMSEKDLNILMASFKEREEQNEEPSFGKSIKVDKNKLGKENLNDSTTQGRSSAKESRTSGIEEPTK